jgi:pyruvate-ferredoxin/flavodoxin oxidoreductase
MPVDQLDNLEEALGGSTARTSNLGDILSRLGEQGERSDVELPAVRRLVQAARAVEQARWRISEGFLGMGRARYGLVVAGGSAAEWAARFPRNPFGAPVMVDLTGGGAELALGIIEGMVADRVAEARVIRQAELALEAPSDLPAKERELERLDWSSLSQEERMLCPPILLLAGSDALPELSGLLTSGLPVKVIMLDECDLLDSGKDPLLPAIAHRGAFALATSVAHPDHLFEGLSAALKSGGPAFISVHAPSPGRHGFSPKKTIERARLAVDSRVNPLLRYDPAATGVFGSRIALDGNPQCEELLASGIDGQSLTPVHWATGEERYKGSLSFSTGEGTRPIDQYLKDSSGVRGSANPTVPGPNGTSLAVGEDLAAAAAARLERWSTLQELAGVVTPFTEAVREQVEEEMREAHQAEIDALKAEAETRVAALERDQAAAQAVRLRDRLLQLAGITAPRAEKRGEGGES